MLITDPKRLLEASVEPRKIKLNFGRVSKHAVEMMARQSVYQGVGRTPEGSSMPDPVEKVGRRLPGSPPLPPVAM